MIAIGVLVASICSHSLFLVIDDKGTELTKEKYLFLVDDENKPT